MHEASQILGQLIIILNTQEITERNTTVSSFHTFNDNGSNNNQSRRLEPLQKAIIDMQLTWLSLKAKEFITYQLSAWYWSIYQVCVCFIVCTHSKTVEQKSMWEGELALMSIRAFFFLKMVPITTYWWHFIHLDTPHHMSSHNDHSCVMPKHMSCHY